MIDDSGIDQLVEMLLRSRELALGDRFEQVLPALDAALFIAGQEMARRLQEDGFQPLSLPRVLN